MGGDYYAFRGPVDEDLALVENRDPYDGEPVFGFPSWGVLLRIQRTTKDSKALYGLENDPQHFQKLKTSGA